MCDYLNLELAAGNGDFEDTRTLSDSLDQLDDAIKAAKVRFRDE